MNTTTAPTVPSTSPSVASSTNASAPCAPKTTLWRTGVAAGLAAAAATVGVAAIALGLGVSLETAPGEAIPVLGFGQLTLFFTAIGVLIARTLDRRAHRPRSTFTRTAVVLTALSLVPDVAISADVATKLTLMLTHLVAAAIVIPALSSRLPQHGRR